MGIKLKKIEFKKTDKTEKAKKPKYIKKGGNGGKRDNSGRKPDMNADALVDIKEKIAGHGQEVIAVKTKTGKLIIKKERILVLLDVLYDKGEGGDIKAIKEYFDRLLGKAVQPLTGNLSLTFEDFVKKNADRKNNT